MRTKHLPSERIHALTHSRPQRHSPFSKAVLDPYENDESQLFDGEPEIPLSVVKAARAPISERPFDRSDYLNLSDAQFGIKRKTKFEQMENLWKNPRTDALKTSATFPIFKSSPGAIWKRWNQHLDGEPEIPLSVVKAARAPISERPFDRSD
ncbi:hypothetical protein CDAR_403831 [Caerostris darwini]|uniref:Uncharacterized protein n=1 Tax=Caerostris darwini TaxID=1538125 RepID=A0AAV4M4C3_9ARAC|nr:hypothetical protein CDAR_403831 [Caerostris darwini]